MICGPLHNSNDCLRKMSTLINIFFASKQKMDLIMLLLTCFVKCWVNKLFKRCCMNYSHVVTIQHVWLTLAINTLWAYNFLTISSRMLKNHISKNSENQNIGDIYAHRFFHVKSTMKGNTSLNQNFDCYRRLSDIKL